MEWTRTTTNNPYYRTERGYLRYYALALSSTTANIARPASEPSSRVLAAADITALPAGRRRRRRPCQLVVRASPCRRSGETHKRRSSPADKKYIRHYIYIKKKTPGGDKTTVLVVCMEPTAAEGGETRIKQQQKLCDFLRNTKKSALLKIVQRCTHALGREITITPG